MSEAAYTQVISIEDLKPGMVLAEDVLSSVGLILLTRDTQLNRKNILKLNMYGIDYVLVREKVFLQTNKENNIEAKSKSIQKIREFRAFQNEYDNGINSLQDHILHIDEGKKIDTSELYSISKDMISIMETKSDIFSFIHNLRGTDDYTYTHSINVSLICNIFGQWLGLSGKTIKDLTVAGLLHDIGKTKIDPKILNKPGKLTEEEFEEIKKHSIYGFRMVEKQNIDQNIKLAILMHHEKYDGSGYPLGATGDQINPFAKMISIADIYDAMTSDRSYREKFCPFKVIETFEQECLGKLDTKFLLSFLKNIAYNYLNCWVRLSSGEEGEIVFIHSHNLSRPIIRVDNTMVDLEEEKDLYIEEII